MTMSTVGILPDLRSPEKIKSDIEDKERMLADLLCFDRVKVNTTDLSRSSGSVEVSGLGIKAKVSGVFYLEGTRTGCC